MAQNKSILVRSSGAKCQKGPAGPLRPLLPELEQSLAAGAWLHAGPGPGIRVRVRQEILGQRNKLERIIIIILGCIVSCFILKSYLDSSLTIPLLSIFFHTVALLLNQTEGLDLLINTYVDNEYPPSDLSCN